VPQYGGHQLKGNLATVTEGPGRVLRVGIRSEVSHSSLAANLGLLVSLRGTNSGCMQAARAARASDILAGPGRGRPARRPGVLHDGPAGNGDHAAGQCQPRRALPWSAAFHPPRPPGRGRASYTRARARASAHTHPHRGWPGECRDWGGSAPGGCGRRRAVFSWQFRAEAAPARAGAAGAAG
jgi:hypothetical protein